MIDARNLEARNERERHRRQARAMSQPGPIMGITDPRFVYTKANATDIRATFARARAGEFFNLQPKKEKQQ